MAKKTGLQGISSTEYVEIFRRRRWFFVLPVIISFFASVILCIVSKPEFKTSATVLVQMVRTGAGVEAGRYETVQQSALYSEVETFSKLFFSKPFLEMLAVELNIDLAGKSPIKAEEKLQELRDALSIETSVTKGVLKVTARNENPAFCARLANTATELFIKYYRQIGSDRSSAEVEFLREQKDLYKKRLEDSEGRLRKFKEENQEILIMGIDRFAQGSSMGAMGIAPVISTMPTRLETYKDTLFDLNLRLEELEKKKKDLSGQVMQGGEDSSLMAEDPIIQEMLKAIAEKSVELSRLKAGGLTEEHPSVVRLKREIKETENIVRERSEGLKSGESKKIFSPQYQQLMRELSSTENQIDTIKIKIERLNKATQQQEEFVRSIPEKEQALRRLQSEYEVNAKTYSELISKLENASINQRMSQQEKGVMFRIVEPAAIPLYPYKPNKKFILLIGLIIGAMAGMGMVSFAEASDVSFRTNEEIEEVLNIPVLGNIDLMYTVKEAELARWKHNLFIFSIGAILLTFSFAFVLRLFL